MNNAMPNEISLEALIAGDRAEFARLVDEYSSPIYRLGLRMLGSPQDAEDVLQDTFINVLTHIHTFEGRSSLATWLYRIASNEALMLIRRKKPEVNLDDVEGGDDDEDLRPRQFVDWSVLPEDELLSGEGQNFIHAHCFFVTRYRRAVHQGDRRSVEPDRDQCQDPFVACPHVSAGEIIRLLW